MEALTVSGYTSRCQAASPARRRRVAHDEPGLEHVAETPLTIAMPKPMALVLGWPSKPIGWSDILSLARDSAGWSAKDHLMHVAAWGHAFLASLDGRPRHEALGIDKATDGEEDTDAINAAIFTRHRHRSPGDVLDALRASHEAMRARVATLRDSATLAQVPGNTFEHYAEHLGWIRELLSRAPRG